MNSFLFSRSKIGDERQNKLFGIGPPGCGWTLGPGILWLSCEYFTSDNTLLQIWISAKSFFRHFDLIEVRLSPVQGVVAVKHAAKGGTGVKIHFFFTDLVLILDICSYGSYETLDSVRCHGAQQSYTCGVNTKT